MGDRIDRSGIEDERDERTGRNAASERIRNQARWVDLQVQEAMRRGEFDDLPGAGKPLDLPEKHDPDWWVKRLIEREKITGIAPAAIGLRKEDAELDAVLDREASPDGVRRVAARAAAAEAAEDQSRDAARRDRPHRRSWWPRRSR